MAKFLPVVNVWDHSVIESLESGDLVLQCGQWIKCGSNDTEYSRFVSYDNGVINAVHKNGDSKDQLKRFRIRSLLNKSSKLILTINDRRALDRCINNAKFDQAKEVINIVKQHQYLYA